MKVVLKRNVRNLGKVGDIVTIKNGYGRNFLIPKNYVEVATKQNVAKLEKMLSELKKQNDELCEVSKHVAEILNKEVLNLVRQAADDNTIYGSVRNRDIYNFICDLLKKNNIAFSLDIGNIKIAEPIKMLGQYIINVELFDEIDATVRLNVCRAVADFETDVVLFDKKREKALLQSKENATESSVNQSSDKENKKNQTVSNTESNSKTNNEVKEEIK